MGGTQDKLSRVRKPRVHITYEVEEGDAVVKKELPFVVGVMGDFSGNPKDAVKKERSFVRIDRDNFGKVMSGFAPELNLKVKNTLKGDGSELGLQLKFKSMDDFDPAKLIQQVEPLKKLMETRNKLNDLMAKVDRSEDLEDILEKVLKNDENLKKFQSGLGVEGEKKPEGGA